MKASKTRPHPPHWHSSRGARWQQRILRRRRSPQRGRHWAVGVEQRDELGVAAALAQRVERGEFHGRDLRASRYLPVEDNTALGAPQEAEQRFPS